MIDQDYLLIIFKGQFPPSLPYIPLSIISQPTQKDMNPDSLFQLTQKLNEDLPISRIKYFLILCNSSLARKPDL